MDAPRGVAPSTPRMSTGRVSERGAEYPSNVASAIASTPIIITGVYNVQYCFQFLTTVLAFAILTFQQALFLQSPTVFWNYRPVWKSVEECTICTWLYTIQYSTHTEETSWKFIYLVSFKKYIYLVSFNKYIYLVELVLSKQILSRKSNCTWN